MLGYRRTVSGGTYRMTSLNQTLSYLARFPCHPIIQPPNKKKKHVAHRVYLCAIESVRTAALRINCHPVPVACVAAQAHDTDDGDTEK